MFGSHDANAVLILLNSVPGVTIATDIICGFPTETDEVCYNVLMVQLCIVIIIIVTKQLCFKFIHHITIVIIVNRISS